MFRLSSGGLQPMPRLSPKSQVKKGIHFITSLILPSKIYVVGFPWDEPKN